MGDLFADVVRVGRFTPATSYQRFAYGCGAILMVSGIVHFGVYLVDGGPWEGPISWRKPVVFGLSFGITLVTWSWFMSFLRPGRVAGWALMGVLSLASVGEVFLVSMQKWRGVESHFNESTPFNGLVFSLMGMLVSIIVLLTLVITVRSFFSMDAPASLALAIRLGLVLMLASQAVGVQMIVEGGNTFGSEGALKVPHAFTLHAAQVLPALAVLLLVSPGAERRRVQIVGLGAVGYATIIASTAVQTYAGRGPLDLTAGSTVLAVAGLALVAASAVLALRGLMRHRPSTPQAV